MTAENWSNARIAKDFQQRNQNQKVAWFHNHDILYQGNTVIVAVGCTSRLIPIGYGEKGFFDYCILFLFSCTIVQWYNGSHDVLLFLCLVNLNFQNMSYMRFPHPMHDREIKFQFYFFAEN